ncbi:nose resistant to fluoxetine protein 6-like [Sabethes cyaneus]|uniref:nose resistant to fluoxetine protein 6-like n=1 Tax=Sabethes cyaneus TaxID=53552 RepID=UPI00237D8D6E|nr:nose resistant to fluoxetine protein 6-like [Sabethes cyaneus]
MKLKVAVSGFLVITLALTSSPSSVGASANEVDPKDSLPVQRIPSAPERTKRLIVDSENSSSNNNNNNNNHSESDFDEVERTNGASGGGGAFSRIDRALLSALKDAIGTLNGTACRRDLNRTLDAVRRGKAWAIAMLDSSAKSTFGIEYGNVYQFGHFDQCMGINRNRFKSNGGNNDDNGSGGILSQYCLADVHAEGYRLRTVVSRKPTPNNYTLVHWGWCFPATCSEAEIEQLLRQTTGYREVAISPKSCHRRESVVISTADMAFVSVILLFVLMVLGSTVYHWKSSCLCRGADKETICGQVLKSFSVVENLRKLVQDSKDDHGLGCINGIKALSMVFILGGHSLLFFVGGAMYNPGFFGEQAKLLRNAFLLNSPLLVDTFLLLSGFLFARLLLIELDKRRGKVNFLLLYIFRYIRLTPAYAAIIALYATWLPRLGSGPLWDRRMELEQTRCQASWWRNLLYVNNYVGTEQLCMFQSWYLAADTQLFILAPLLLYPMWRLRRQAALTLVGTVALLSVVIPFCVTYFGQLDPSLMYYTDELVDVQTNAYYVNAYVKTHMRATAYIFGIIAGYLVHLMQEKNITIGRYKVALLWLGSSAIGTASMFGVSIFYNATGTENYLYNALYAALHRFGWSLSNGWLVLACVTGHAGPLKKFLSSPVLVPISRLTYCAYLTNGLVELYISASQRTARHSSVVGLTAVTLSHVILTFLAALGLCLMFESPIHGIEKILLRRRRRPASGGSAVQHQHHRHGTGCTTGSDSSTGNTHSTSDDSSA